MAVQNAYNNYMGRQQKKPINNFKEKVKNSLGGVKTQTNTTTPATNITTPPVSHSKPIQAYSNTNTPKATPNPITTPPVANNTPATPVAQQSTPTTPTTPQATSQVGEGQGLISISEINDAYTKPTSDVSNTPVDAPITPQQVMEVANNPEVQKQAYSENKTPQQMAQELLEEQKKQLQADWEQKQAEIKLQQEQAQAQFDQSKVDADKAYGETIDSINQDRYNRQQDLNISGSKRGIQYSPQQLGLETVANINTNKNITEAGKQRNELLNKLQQQINELNANILMSSQASVNDYNKALAQLNADYANKVMDWTYNDNKTEEDRNWQQSQTEADRLWQEQQTQKDREWQEKMEQANKDWQANQNQLDRDNQKSGRGSYSGGGYSSSFTPYSRSNYGGYSNYSSSRMGGYDDSAFQSSLLGGDEIARQVYDNEFKNTSTDLYNALDAGGSYDLYDRANAYNALTQDMYNYGAVDPVTKERMDNTKNTALKHLQSKAYARDTNTPFQIGNTLYQPQTPVRDSYKDKIASSRYTDQKKYDEKFGVKRPADEKFKQNVNSRAESLMSNMKKNTTKKEEPKKTTTTNKTKSKVATSVAKSKENAKKASQNSTKNSKTSVKKAVTNTKKSVANSKANTKKSTNKAFENLKKNVKKLFKKK